MREIWETRFGNAQLKIKRANKHIADIEKRLLSSQDAYHISLGIQTETGKQFLYYSLIHKYIRADLALMIGDAIHNLVCALDITWIDTLLRLKLPTKRAKFPVGQNREELKSGLEKNRKILPDSALFKLMVDDLKSYEGGDADIWAIHRLDIHDKHHLLIPVLNVLSIEGVELEQENGEVDVLTLALTGPIPDRIEVPLGSKLKNYGHATFEIKFRHETTDGLEVIPTLKRFSKKVERIVRTLTRIGCPVTATRV